MTEPPWRTEAQRLMEIWENAQPCKIVKRMPLRLRWRRWRRSVTGEAARASTATGPGECGA